MKMYANSISVLLAAALLLALVSPGCGQVGTNPSEESAEDSLNAPGSEAAGMRPAEDAMEDLFEKGIGSAWVGGDPFASSTGTGHDQMKNAASPEYRIIGYLDVTSGLIVAPDSGASLHFAPGPGSYPVYGYFVGDEMTGIYIDFDSSIAKI
jgi:hypothetical protein